MRDGANRVIGFALLASLVLHAALFALLPQYRELSALVPPEPEPLIARVERLAPPAPEPQPPVPEVRKPAPPKPKPAPRDPVPVAAPALTPAPAPAAPLFEPQPVPEPAPAPAPAAPPAPLVRVDPRLLLQVPAPAPDVRRARALARYKQDIKNAAPQFKIYPRAAIDNNWIGEIVVAMAIDARGEIADLRVVSSTGYPLLDRFALEMFRDAHAVVRIPETLGGRPFELRLEAVYELNRPN